MNQRLGRGLDFLLKGKEEGVPGSNPASASEASPGDGSVLIDPERIQPNPWQPRTEFDEEGIRELSDSIREHGLMQPLLVRAVGSEYQLVAGERRLLASRRAGLEKVPAIVRSVDDGEMLTLAIVENVQRRDLNPVEKARAYQRLATEQSLSHQRVAELCGVGRSTVSNALRILELEEHQLVALSDGQITEGHARSLLAEKDPARREQLFREVMAGELSVRGAEDSVAKARPEPEKKKATDKGRKSGEAKLLERDLREALGGLPVRIQESGAKGRVVIRYRSLEEFDRLFRQITGKTPDL